MVKILPAFIGLILIPSSISFALPAEAQIATPQVIITWQATQSYAPPTFLGKTLPGPGSSVTAAVEILNGGRVADISSLPIYWYLNNNLVGSGAGKQSIAFKALNAGQIMSLRVQIPDYPAGGIIKTARIPVVKPAVVIESLYPGNIFHGSTAHLLALPYFFKVGFPGALVYNWSVNGTPAAIIENPQVADLSVTQGTPSGSTLSVSLSVNDPNQLLDTAQASLNLTYGQ